VDHSRIEVWPASRRVAARPPSREACYSLVLRNLGEEDSVKVRAAVLTASVAWILSGCSSDPGAETPVASGQTSHPTGSGAGRGGLAAISTGSTVAAPAPGGAPPDTGGAPGVNTPSNVAAGGSAAGAQATGGSSGCLFSFFVTSLAAMQRESGQEVGFGGDLGGLTGADDLCRRIAETSLACAGQKQWRAFLSTTTEDAIDRVGTGPWHDRVGRLVANEPAELAQERPQRADPAIINDLPNEDGVPNHAPEGTLVDNHDVLTGSDEQGRFVAAGGATCNDWTSAAAGTPRPRVGHSWPARNAAHWISAHDASGCLPGVSLSSTTPGPNGSVGAMGGYGAIYCLALSP
jgi:hypothetical protein